MKAGILDLFLILGTKLSVFLAIKKKKKHFIFPNYVQDSWELWNQIHTALIIKDTGFDFKIALSSSYSIL